MEAYYGRLWLAKKIIRLPCSQRKNLWIEI